MNITLRDGSPLTFFHGKTYDGHAWVLAYQGGHTASIPCIVTGLLPMLCKASGRIRSHAVRFHLNAAVSDLRALLPYIDAPNVRSYYDRALTKAGSR